MGLMEDIGIDEERDERPFSFSTSPGFAHWLAGIDASLGFTTYQASKLHFIGTRDDGELSIFERTFARSMGMATNDDARTLFLATQHQLYRFDNLLLPGQQTPDGYDSLYRPNQSWITGDLDIHDVGIERKGRPVFVATRFSCLATVSEGYSFRPIWRPSFITDLQPEDRCHLNGMAMKKGKPAFVTAVAQTDSKEGWRDHRVSGGMVIDVASSEIIAKGLSMPHSPRLHNGELYVLNSGAGHFGRVDLATGQFEPIVFCPGYARGLAFFDNYAVIGLSQAREKKTFAGLPLHDALGERGLDPRCGLLVVDLNSGNIVHQARIEGVIRELYDVAFLPGIKRPLAIGLKNKDISRIISIDDQR